MKVHRSLACPAISEILRCHLQLRPDVVRFSDQRPQEKAECASAHEPPKAL